jgi:hypothetical protein
MSPYSSLDGRSPAEVVAAGDRAAVARLVSGLESPGAV